MSEHRPEKPEKACCAPSNRGGDEPKKAENWTAGRMMVTEASSGSTEGMEYLSGGEFLMGTDDAGWQGLRHRSVPKESKQRKRG